MILSPYMYICFIKLTHLQFRLPHLLSVPCQIWKTKRYRREILSLLLEIGVPSKNMMSDFALEVAKIECEPVVSLH